VRVVSDNTAFIKSAFAFIGALRPTSASSIFTCRNPLIRLKRFLLCYTCLMFSTVCCFLRDDFCGFIDLGREVDNCEGRSFLFK
jgi:hypothetical protein